MSETQIEVPRESKTASRTRWAVAVCSVAALGLMLAVIVLARQDEKARDGGTQPRIGDADAFGGAQPRVDRDAASACGTVDVKNPPVIEFLLDGGELDLGLLKQGVQLTRTVEFRNAGKGPLCVYDVKTGCGCLKASLLDKARQRYEPGEKGGIELHVNTAGRQGVLRKPVTILSNDPRNPRRSFKTKLDINAGLMADRSFLDFGTSAPGRPVTRALVLRSPKDKAKWEVLGVAGTRKLPGQDLTAYTFEVEPVADPRFRRFKISVTHPGLNTVGTFSDSLVITTSHPERPEMLVPTRIHVVPRILSRSRVISLGYVRSGRARPPTRARIQPGAPGVAFEITGVEVLPKEGEPAAAAGPGFTATFGSDKRGWWVDVKYDGQNRKPGLLEAQLVVHTSDAEQPEVRIPVRATVRTPR